jgi:UTP--glucose-1-phosphate uridylyltransferase
MAVVAVLRVPKTEVFRYGIIKGTPFEPRLIKVEEMVEKPPVDEAPSDLAIIGRYILPPDIFPILQRTPPGRGGEVQITDALSILAREKGVLAYEFEGDRYDAGDQLGFLKANVVFGLRKADIGPRLEEFLKGLLRTR